MEYGPMGNLHMDHFRWKTVESPGVIFSHIYIRYIYIYICSIRFSISSCFSTNSHFSVCENAVPRHFSLGFTATAAFLPGVIGHDAATRASRGGSGETEGVMGRSVLAGGKDP
jgi:hypothetical protein